jgi:hypothetical protein
VLLSVPALLLASCYPLMKRYTHLPQVVLGWPSPGPSHGLRGTARGAAAGPVAAVYGNLLWTVVYDTKYAMVDRKDDLEIGIKSTAILFGESDRRSSPYYRYCAWRPWRSRAASSASPGPTLLSLRAAGLFGYHLYLIRDRDEAACFRAFKHNSWVGLSIFLGIAGSYALTPLIAGAGREPGHRARARFRAAMRRRKWEALRRDDYPFLRHDFLLGLEQADCTTGRRAGSRRTCCLHDGGRTLAILPAWLKSHSYGEYVFDWAWADAWRRMGLAYYPKLLTAIPFTPATGPRLLHDEDLDRRRSGQTFASRCRHVGRTAAISILARAVSRRRRRGSAGRAGLHTRHQVQFHWFNRGYRDFDDFLGAFPAASARPCAASAAGWRNRASA